MKDLEDMINTSHVSTWIFLLKIGIQISSLLEQLELTKIQSFASYWVLVGNFTQYNRLNFESHGLGETFVLVMHSLMHTF